MVHVKGMPERLREFIQNDCLGIDIQRMKL